MSGKRKASDESEFVLHCGKISRCAPPVSQAEDSSQDYISSAHRLRNLEKATATPLSEPVEFPELLPKSVDDEPRNELPLVNWNEEDNEDSQKDVKTETSSPKAQPITPPTKPITLAEAKKRLQTIAEDFQALLPAPEYHKTNAAMVALQQLCVTLNNLDAIQPESDSEAESSKAVKPKFVTMETRRLLHICRYALQANSLAFQDMPEAIRNDREIAILAVSKAAHCCYHLSDEQKDDEEIMTAAAGQDGASVIFASERLRNTKKYMLAAIKSNPDAYLYCGNKLNEDEDIVNQTLARKGALLANMPRAVRHCDTFVAVAVCNDKNARQFSLVPPRPESPADLPDLLESEMLP